MTRRMLSTEVGWELLSDQQRAFAEEWVRTHNFTKALDAGKYAYDPRVPSRMARRMLRRVKGYVNYLEARALRQTMVSIDAVRMQLSILGYSNLLDYYIVDTDLNAVRPKTIGELTREEAAAVKSWTTIPLKKKRPDGTEYDVWVLHEIELHDKRGPLQDLLKSLGGMPTGKPGETPPAAPPGEGGLDFAKLDPQEVREIDSMFKKIRSRLSAAQDAQAIPVSRGVDGGQANGAGQPQGRSLPPPAK